MTGRVFIVTAFRGRVTQKLGHAELCLSKEVGWLERGRTLGLWVLGGTSPGPRTGLTWNIYYLSPAFQRTNVDSPSMSLYHPFPPKKLYGKGEIWTASTLLPSFRKIPKNSPLISSASGVVYASGSVRSFPWASTSTWSFPQKNHLPMGVNVQLWPKWPSQGFCGRESGASGLLISSKGRRCWAFLDGILYKQLGSK